MIPGVSPGSIIPWRLPASLSHNSLLTLFRDRGGILWIGTGGGGINKYNPHKQQINHFYNLPGNPNSLNHNSVWAIHEDSDGTLWIGTPGGLNKFNPIDDSFSVFTQKNGLPSDIVYGILEDPKGNLWLSTNKGICRFDPNTGYVKILDLSDGLQGYEYNSGASFAGNSGTMYFGGLNGFNSFCPANIEDNRHIPPIVFTRLKTESEMNRIFTKYKISTREQEVVHLILKGKSNKDIEDLLFISMKTVKSHVYNIFQKFGVKNRLELINLIQKSVKE